MGNWSRVSRRDPCPICGRPDWCLVAKGGSAAICARVENGAIKRVGEKGAGWLHSLDRASAWRPVKRRRRVVIPPAHSSGTDFKALAARYANAVHPAALAHLAVSLGLTAVIYAGFGAKDHARASIQLLSGEVPERRVFTHTGWRKVGDQHVYLHGGGAIGTASRIEVKLHGALSPFELPDPPDGDDRIAAIRSSLRMLELAPDGVTIPLFAAIWRAVLAPADFALHVSGPTGAGKSEIATLAQQHFGAGLDARHLAGSWSSTGNALEVLAFSAKDAMLVIDDFAPGGSSNDVQRYHRDADRVLRAQGNRSGRQRLRPDGTPRDSKPPRGLIVSTGEDVPRGQSLRARLLVLESGRRYVGIEQSKKFCDRSELRLRAVGGCDRREGVAEAIEPTNGDHMQATKETAQ